MFDVEQIHAKVAARMSGKDKDTLVNRFMQENPEIMLACVHWKVSPSPPPQRPSYTTHQKMNQTEMTNAKSEQIYMDATKTNFKKRRSSAGSSNVMRESP